MPLNSLEPRHPRVLLVDDNDLIRAALRTLLEQCCDIVGEAVDGREAVGQSSLLQPDLVLLDVSLPDASGFRVLREIARCSPRSRIIFVSSHVSEPYIREAARLGASGYVSKSKVSTHLLPAIRDAFGRDSHHRVRRARSGIGSRIGKQLAMRNAEASQPAVTEMDRNEIISPNLRVHLPACREAQRLLNDFADSVKTVLKLLEQQFDAVLSADLSANRFDLLIHDANERKQDAKYAYLRHIQTHGCDAMDGRGPC